MGKRTKGPGPLSRMLACFQKSDDQKQPSQQASGQGQQTNDDQKQPSQQASGQGQQTNDDQKQQLQWTLEQTQLRYKGLQDKYDKLMDLVPRLLGFCAISGFTTYLSNSTWQDLTGSAKSNLRWSVILLFIAVIIAVTALSAFMVMTSVWDWLFPDIATLEQEQSTEEKTISLIETLSFQIKLLRVINCLIAIAVFIMYLIYAVSLELLVLIIINSF